MRIHPSHSPPQAPAPSARTLHRNSNLKGLAQYILRRVSKKSAGKPSTLVSRLNQMIKVSSEKMGDVIVRNIDSITARKPVVTRNLVVVLIWKDRRTASFDRLWSRTRVCLYHSMDRQSRFLLRRVWVPVPLSERSSIRSVSRVAAQASKRTGMQFLTPQTRM